MAMFEQPNKNVPKESQETIIGADVILNGNLKSNSNIQINGTIKGKIMTEQNISIGETAVIEGTLEAQSIIVSGAIKGNIYAKEDLDFNPSGKIFGDVAAKNLIIKKGAIFVGKSDTIENQSQKIDPIMKEAEKETEKVENAQIPTKK